MLTAPNVNVCKCMWSLMAYRTAQIAADGQIAAVAESPDLPLLYGG